VRLKKHQSQRGCTPSEAEWGDNRGSRPFSWWAFLCVVLALAVGFFVRFADVGNWGYKLAMLGAGVVAMLLVAPSLFSASPDQPRSNHPDPDVRALANGEIDFAEYRARQEAGGKSAG
jgi:hypothetical protein